VLNKVKKLSKGKAELYQQKVSFIKKMQERTRCPSSKEELTKLKEVFDLNDYFYYLDRIWVEDGYCFSFDYYKEHMGSEPILVIYPKDEIPDIRSLELRSNKYLEHIQLDGTLESYLQYTILKIIGGQFALGWHANYNDTEIVLTTKKISEIIKKVNNNFDTEEKEKALAIDPLPEFIIEKNQVSVKIILFSKWGGFTEKTYQIEITAPNNIKAIEERELAQYHCGYLY